MTTTEERLAALQRRRGRDGAPVATPIDRSAGAPSVSPNAPSPHPQSSEHPESQMPRPQVLGHRSVATSSKILAAGASATAVLGIVAAFGIANRSASAATEGTTPPPVSAQPSPISSLPIDDGSGRSGSGLPAVGGAAPDDASVVVILDLNGHPLATLTIDGSEPATRVVTVDAVAKAADPNQSDPAAPNTASPTEPLPASGVEPAPAAGAQPVPAPRVIDVAVPAPPAPVPAPSAAPASPSAAPATPAPAPAPAPAPQPQATSSGS